jgi:hypothetical protein
MGQGSKVPLPISFATALPPSTGVFQGCHIRPAAVNQEQRARESKTARTGREGASGVLRTRLTREPERAPEIAKMPSARHNRCSGTPHQ